jgi:predicted DNA-binding transcriptional regulator AlpA
MDLPMVASKSAVPAVDVLTTPIDPSQILTVKAVAERLKVSERWVYEKTRRRSQDPPPYIRIGRYLRFNCLEVSAWLLRRSGMGRAA